MKFFYLFFNLALFCVGSVFSSIDTLEDVATSLRPKSISTSKFPTLFNLLDTTQKPTLIPTQKPTLAPTQKPTLTPTQKPTTKANSQKYVGFPNSVFENPSLQINLTNIEKIVYRPNILLTVKITRDINVDSNFINSIWPGKICNTFQLQNYFTYINENMDMYFTGRFPGDPLSPEIQSLSNIDRNYNTLTSPLLFTVWINGKSVGQYDLNYKSYLYIFNNPDDTGRKVLETNFIIAFLSQKFGSGLHTASFSKGLTPYWDWSA